MLPCSLCPKLPFFLVSPPPAGSLSFSVIAMAATTGCSSSSASAAAAADKPAPVVPLLTVKLDPTKYPLWLAQIIPFLNSNGLMSLVDGTAMRPPAFLLDPDGKPTNATNPAYDDWFQMDQFVLSLINSSLSHFVVATLEGSISARATWVALEALLLSGEQQHLVPTLTVSVSDHSAAAAAASPGCGFDHVASGEEMSGGGGCGGGGTTGEEVSGKKGLPGFKSFSPTEEELVAYYLKKKIEGKDSEFRDFIPLIDHVWKREPRNLPAVFFSKPDYKHSKRDRCNRTTDEGKYKITCKDREIKDELSKTVIGKKRYLAFKDHVPSAKKTKYVIHEYSLTKTELAKLGVGPNPNQQKEFVICCLKNKSANSKKQKDVSICGKGLAEPAIGGEITSNSEEDHAAATDMIQGPDEHLTDKDVLLGTENRNECAESKSPNGFSPTDNNDISTFGSPGSFDVPGVLLWSDFDDPLKEPSCAVLGVNMDSTFLPPQQRAATSATSFGGFGVGSPDGFLFSDIVDLLKEPFCANQPHQPPHPPHPHQPSPAPHPPQRPPASQSHQPPPPSTPQNYCSSSLPSALCTKQGNVPSLCNDDCSKQLSRTGNNISTNYHHEPVSNTACSVQNGATDERFSEVYKISTNDHNESVSSEQEENLGSIFHPIRPQDYTLLSPRNMELGDVMHANNYIDMQWICFYMAAGVSIYNTVTRR